MGVQRGSGFGLVELLVSIAVVGLLGAVALPVYRDYGVRARLVEGVVLAEAAKRVVEANHDTAAVLAVEAQIWNAQSENRGVSSQYVRSILIDAVTGEVTVTFDEARMSGIPAGATLVYTPYLRSAGGFIALVSALDSATSSGVGVEWGCSSSTNDFARGRGLPALTNATVPARLAPSECR